MTRLDSQLERFQELFFGQRRFGEDVHQKPLADGVVPGNYDADAFLVAEQDVARRLPDRDEPELSEGLQDLSPGQAREFLRPRQLDGYLNQPCLLLFRLGVHVLEIELNRILDILDCLGLCLAFAHASRELDTLGHEPLPPLTLERHVIVPSFHRGGEAGRAIYPALSGMNAHGRSILKGSGSTRIQG